MQWHGVRLTSGRIVPRLRGVVGVGLLYLVSYWSLDWVSFLYQAEKTNITPWDPPVAASLILVFLRGLKWAPLLFVGAFSADLMEWHFHVPIAPAALGDASEALVYAGAAWVMRSRLKIDPDLWRFRDVSWFLVVATAAAAVQSIVYVFVFWSSGLIATDDINSLIFEYWVGDTVGVTIVAPFALIHRGLLTNPFPMTAIYSWEVLAQAASIGLAVWVLFFVHSAVDQHLFYPLFIPLVWIAARHGLPGVTLAVFTMQVGIIGTAVILGTQQEPAVRLQIQMFALSWTGLLLGGVFSERQRALASVVRSEARLKTLIEMAPDAMLITDGVGNVEFANKRFELLYGSPSADVVGRNMSELVSFSGMLRNAELAVHRADGSDIPVEISTATVTIGGQDTSVVTVHDITARKQAEVRLRQRRAAAEQASRINLTEGLAAAIAHELNQPLAAIITYASACQKILGATANMPARALEQMAKVVAQATRAGDIIRRLRELFRSSDVKAAPVQVVSMITDVLALLEDEATRTGAVIEVDVPDRLVAEIDRLQIEQVLINLVRNSLEALGNVPDGARKVRIEGKHSERGHIEISVIDTGPGIAPEINKRLFRPFVTSHSSGMGLGLTISRSIVQAHGGRLWAEQGASSGAVLRFTLPTSDRVDEHAAS